MATFYTMKFIFYLFFYLSTKQFVKYYNFGLFTGAPIHMGSWGSELPV